jgi:hypothetical protein
MREEFERDAGPMGFDLTRNHMRSLGVEPWGDYVSDATGHRWAGWAAATENKAGKLTDERIDAVFLNLPRADETGQSLWRRFARAIEAEIRAEEPAEDAVHGKCAAWLRLFTFKHMRDPFPQETWDAATVEERDQQALAKRYRDAVQMIDDLPLPRPKIQAQPVVVDEGKPTAWVTGCPYCLREIHIAIKQ